VVFACENNGYAEATPSWYAVSADDIASRAEGYGMPGVVVDGMDVFAVYDAAGEAIARARAGEGPTFLELKTYRYHGHFHADVPLNYRTEEEEKYYHDRDAIKSFEKRVTEQKLMTARKLKSIRDAIEKEMVVAVDFALNSPMPDASALYDDVYVNYSNPIPGLR
jgi:pyruvate dehydrogenase E1 component alpha subunit